MGIQNQYVEVNERTQDDSDDDIFLGHYLLSSPKYAFFQLTEKS